MTLSKLNSIYDEIGYNDDSDHIYKFYSESLNKFKEEDDCE